MINMLTILPYHLNRKFIIKMSIYFIICLPRMRKYTMLVGAILLIAINTYGFLISVIVQPVTPAILITSLLVIILSTYIEMNKKRVLLRTRVKQSFLMFGLLILFQVYFVILSFTELIYLDSVQHHIASHNVNLTHFTAGLNVLPIHKVESINLPYYFINFIFFMFYIRCYYTMFWKQNIIFIFRYLKARVGQLNQSLLSHLPKIQLTDELQQSICSLCLQNYNREYDVTKLHCQHVFHLDCIKIWVMKSNNCPLCRKKVVF